MGGYCAMITAQRQSGNALTEHILLRINKQERRAIGITLFDYSVLAQQTNMGPRSFPLVGFEELPIDMRDMVLDLLLQPPVRDILALSAYTPTLTDTTPIIAIHPLTIPASSV